MAQEQFEVVRSVLWSNLKLGG